MKLFIKLLFSAIAIFLGSLLVFPPKYFIEFKDVKYYEEPNQKFISNDDKVISYLKENNLITITVKDDSTLVEIRFLENEIMFRITIDEDIYEFNSDAEVDNPEIKPYFLLAKSILEYTEMMNEDYTPALYVLTSFLCLISLIVNHFMVSWVRRKPESTTARTGQLLSTVGMTFSFIVLVMLIII